MVSRVTGRTSLFFSVSIGSVFMLSTRLGLPRQLRNAKVEPGALLCTGGLPAAGTARMASTVRDNL